MEVLGCHSTAVGERTVQGDALHLLEATPNTRLTHLWMQCSDRKVACNISLTSSVPCPYIYIYVNAISDTTHLPDVVNSPLISADPLPKPQNCLLGTGLTLSTQPLASSCSFSGWGQGGGCPTPHTGHGSEVVGNGGAG